MSEEVEDAQPSASYTSIEDDISQLVVCLEFSLYISREERERLLAGPDR